MSSPRRALERVLVHAAALATALGGGIAPALAQDDPFAIPKNVTSASASRAGTPGLSDVVVDGRRRARMVDLEWLAGDRLAIEADHARAAGMPVADGVQGKVSLDSLGLAKWSFDPTLQVLTVSLIRKSDGVNLIDLTPRPFSDGDSAALTWARLDYDLTATRTPRQVSAGGTFAAAAGRGNFFAGTTFSGAGALGGISRFRRLDTQVQMLFPAKGLVATAGDLITAGSLGQRPVRVGGLQVASDYSLRPDIVTAPLPAFTGRVAVPTAVDLVIDGTRSQIGKIEPGEFTVRNVPSSNGRGRIALIVRDELGRESVQTVSFYSSPQMLAPGLRQFAANIGFVRRRYGQTSDDYGMLVASGYYRRGLSPSLTAALSGETAGGLINLGARADLAIANLALGSFETRFSRSPDGGSGYLLNGALDSGGRTLSGRVSVVWPSRSYQDAAFALGDPGVQRSVLGQLSYGKDEHRLQLSAGRFERMADPRGNLPADRGQVLNLTASTAIARRFNVNLAGIYRNGTQGRSLAATLGLSVRLGGGYSGTSATVSSDRPMETTAYFRRADSTKNPLGYTIETTRGERDRQLAEATWRPAQAILSAQVLRDGGALSLRGNARGSLIVAGGGVFARHQSESSYALVRTGGIGGITVLRENQAVGKTSNKGLLLIDNITGHVPINYDIDADKLPDEVLARRTQLRLTVPRRAVGLLAMDVVRYVPRPVRLLDAAGAPIPAGTTLTAQPSGEQVIVGFDGELAINSAGRDRSIELAGTDGTACRFALDALPDAGSTEELPELRCTASIEVPVTIAVSSSRHGRGRERGPSRR